jgi:hypothetical protein
MFTLGYYGSGSLTASFKYVKARSKKITRDDLNRALVVAKMSMGLVPKGKVKKRLNKSIEIGNQLMVVGEVIKKQQIEKINKSLKCPFPGCNRQSTTERTFKNHLFSRHRKYAIGEGLISRDYGTKKKIVVRQKN